MLQLAGSLRRQMPLVASPHVEIQQDWAWLSTAEVTFRRGDVSALIFC